MFSALDADRHDGLGLALSAALPLAMFVIVNGSVQAAGGQALFFAPFGLPGWLGAALHLGTLPLFGVARWMVAGHGETGRSANRWIVALLVSAIAFPFLVGLLDTLMISIVSFAMFILALSSMARAAAVDRKAALVMAPAMAWMGFSAFIGLSFAAAWSPPFAVTNSHGAV